MFMPITVNKTDKHSYDKHTSYSQKPQSCKISTSNKEYALSFQKNVNKNDRI